VPRARPAFGALPFLCHSVAVKRGTHRASSQQALKLPEDSPGEREQGKEHRPLARDQTVQLKEINLIVGGGKKACSCWLQAARTVRKHGPDAARIKQAR